MQERPRIAGKWKPMPDEVYDKLLPCNPCCDRVYLCIRFGFRVEEDYGSPGEWVTGKVRATNVEIIRKSGVKENLFYRKLWPELKKAGLVEDSGDGWVTLPYVWRKLDVSISAAEVREMERSQKESDDRVEDLERRLENMEQLVREMKSGHTIDQEPKLMAEDVDNPSVESGSQPVSTGSQPVSTGSQPEGSSFKEESKVSLSSLNTVISGFYKGIGQKRISKVKRERGLKIGRKLRDDGFTLENIAFAVEWTLENAKEELYDFAIIQHTIGQSIAARRKIKSERLRIEERHRAEEAERLEREAEEQQRQELETYKANLSPEERAELREKARAELVKERVPPGMITDLLLDIRESLVLTKELKQKR